MDFETNLGKRSKAVGSAASIGNNVKLGLVLLFVHTHNKHGCIFAGGRNDHLLSTTLINKTIKVNKPHDEKPIGSTPTLILFLYTNKTN